MNIPHSVLASALAQFDQPAPPTVREILAAYQQRGDGDKAMLMALLHAKTAEDERLASIASLHRSVLDLYYRSPGASVITAQSPLDSYESRSNPSSPSSPGYSRKRTRRSRSRSPSSLPDEISCSYRRSDPANYSPRTAASMAIDSLLSSSKMTRPDSDESEERQRDLTLPPLKRQSPTLPLPATSSPAVAV